MTIIRESTNVNENDKKLIYKLTKAPGENARNCAGSIEGVKYWALYNDESEKGEVRTVLSILTETGKISTISPTFIREFLDIAEIMGDDPFDIKILEGTSKNGRNYVSCTLA